MENSARNGIVKLFYFNSRKNCCNFNLFFLPAYFHAITLHYSLCSGKNGLNRRNSNPVNTYYVLLILHRYSQSYENSNPFHHHSFHLYLPRNFSMLQKFQQLNRIALFFPSKLFTIKLSFSLLNCDREFIKHC